MTETAPNASPPEWYITTDDAALTLRVTPDLAIGETAGGELALNNAEQATQWVRFAVHDSGELELLCISEAASIHVAAATEDNAACTRVEVAAGTLIELPNNRLLVSDRFRGQDQNDTPLRIAHEQAYQAPAASQPAEQDTASVIGDESRPADNDEAGEQEPFAKAFIPRDANRTKDALARRRDALDNLASPHSSPDSSPHAKPGPTNTTEEALVPVAANAPFDDADLNAYLDRPIDLRQRSSNDQFNPSTEARIDAPVTANTGDFYTQQTPRPLRTGLIPGLSQQQSRRYLYALAGVITLTLIAALAATMLNEPKPDVAAANGTPASVTAENPAPDNVGSSLISGESNAAPAREAPAQTAPATVDAVPRVQRSTDALLQSVDRVLAEGDPSDASVWDFAIQTYEFVLAQEPNNQQARDALASARAEQRAIQNTIWGEDGRVVITIDKPAPADSEAGPETAAVPTAESAGLQAIIAAARVAPAAGRENAADRGSAANSVDPAASSNLALGDNPPLPELQTRQLDQAEGRLELGQVISPASASAVSLIIPVLEKYPTDRRAINLLNRAADLLLVEADTAHVSGNEYLARNVLEEIFAFHPRHVGSNQRWTEWTGQPPRLPKDVAPLPGSEADGPLGLLEATGSIEATGSLEPVIDLRQTSPPDLRVPLPTPQ